ncbi:MAG: CBS domain-containing protein [Candidatus Altiarchaeota archaeon]|nr:CBS domain-containing protein [Candidatus Altiarchaeota archaeon]
MSKRSVKAGRDGFRDRGPREFKSHVVKKEGDVMQFAERDVVTTQPLNSVKNVAKLMKKHDFRRIPVTDAGTGRLEGLATAIDILDFLGGGEKYNIITKDYKGNLPAAINCPISKIMREASFVEKTASIDDVIGIILNKHTSSIPVVEDAESGKVVAIVTERDVLPQEEFYGMTVGEAMKKDPIISSPGMMISDVSKLMVRNGFRRLPVIREDKLIGVVTVFDILEFLGYGEFHHVDAEEALSERVGEIMSKGVITVAKDQDLGYVARLVHDTGLGGFPVVEEGDIVGMVTISDLLKAVYKDG